MFEEVNEEIILAIKVIPNSRANQVMGWDQNELKIKLAAVPENGKANKKLVQFLSSFLQVSQKNIILLSGEASRHKRLLIKDLKLSELIGVFQKLPIK